MEHNMKHEYLIKEDSFIAKIAARKLRTQSVAIVIGKTIHLHNTTKEALLQNDCWLKHELCHIRQFKRYGFIPFILKYLVESIKKGYHLNKYEIEARRAEKE
ncbi:MAG: DUF4157 domain-containing protein [Ferruginibacter sp.]